MHIYFRFLECYINLNKTLNIFKLKQLTLIDDRFYHVTIWWPMWWIVEGGNVGYDRVVCGGYDHVLQWEEWKRIVVVMCWGGKWWICSHVVANVGYYHMQWWPPIEVTMCCGCLWWVLLQLWQMKVSWLQMDMFTCCCGQCWILSFSVVEMIVVPWCCRGK